MFKLNLKLYFIILLAFFITLPSLLLANDNILGVWLTKKKDSKVEIFKKNNQYFGKIIWLDEASYVDGKPPKDSSNPDKSLRDRSLLGLEVLKNFEYNSKKKEWRNGKIYDPMNGSTYSCYIRQSDPNTLKIRGYIGVALVGRTEIWKKTSE